ncbi:MAG TPA: hypothetical protein VLL72_03140 [Kiloniellales bacterium]|nr:hypothetical protein [Kiloniellales bacterium]
MHGLEPLDDSSGDTVFRDVIFLALAGFVAMVLLLLPHLNPPAKAEQDAPAPGNVIVELAWPEQIDADVDLWVEAPGDYPVGYSNKGGTFFNLLRDDLGEQSDVTPVNYEVSYSRGVPSGEYCVNVHLYRDLSGKLPLPITVSVSVKPSPDKGAKRILFTKLELSHQGEERTAFRFRLDESGNLVPGSVHDTPRSLRSIPRTRG